MSVKNETAVLEVRQGKKDDIFWDVQYENIHIF